MKPCLKCGDLVRNASYCVDCMPDDKSPENRKRQAHLYDYAWRKLSAQARKLQPWCLDCGARKNLSADHLPIAHWKLDNGIPLTLTDVEVVCLPCNDRRGPAEADSERYLEWKRTEYLPASKHIHEELSTGKEDLGGIQRANKGVCSRGLGDKQNTLTPDSASEDSYPQVNIP